MFILFSDSLNLPFCISLFKTKLLQNYKTVVMTKINNCLPSTGRTTTHTQWKSCMLLWLLIIFYYTPMTKAINNPMVQPYFNRTATSCQCNTNTAADSSRPSIKNAVQILLCCSTFYLHYPTTIDPISIVVVVLLDLCIQRWLILFL